MKFHINSKSCIIQKHLAWKLPKKKNRKKKTSRCPRWRRLFCSLRSVLSYCQKAFLNLSRMRVPILEIRTRFVSWAMRYRCYTARCPSELSYLQDASGNAETHFPFRHWFQTLKVWMNQSLHLVPAAGTCVSSRPLAPWILQMLSCSGNTWS